MKISKFTNVCILAALIHTSILYDSKANAGERFTGLTNAFSVKLDERYPDDHLDILNSSYPSEVDRTKRALQLSMMQIMLLDEVLHASEDDIACSKVAARDSALYEDCVTDFYHLPKLLIHHNIGDSCHSELSLPERVACLLLIESLMNLRRHSMQTHYTWRHKQSELDKELVKIWRENGEPNALTWHSIPVAIEIAKLDSLLLFVHTVDIATAVQALEIYEYILATSDPYILGSRASSVRSNIDLSNRRTQIQGARNRTVLPFISRPGFARSGERGVSWKNNYKRWIYDARFGISGYGMNYVPLSAFNIHPLQSLEIPELSVKSDNTNASNTGKPKIISPTNHSLKPAKSNLKLWVPGGLPVRIHSPVNSSTTISSEQDEVDIEKPITNPPVSNTESEEKIPEQGKQLRSEEWQGPRLPESIAECKERWEFGCPEPTLGKIVEYEIEILEKTLSVAPIMVIPLGGGKEGKKLFKTVGRFLSVVSYAAISSNLYNKYYAGAAIAALELIPHFANSPNFQKDIPHYKRKFNEIQEQVTKIMKVNEERQAGLREARRYIIANHELDQLSATNGSKSK